MTYKALQNSRVHASAWRHSVQQENSGGEGGIRTPGTRFSAYNGLANRRIQPLCHLSAANVLQHCNLLPHLVTVPPSVAAFWCTAVNPMLETNCKVTLRSYPATSYP